MMRVTRSICLMTVMSGSLFSSAGFAAVFPGAISSRSQGLYDGLYMRLRDIDGPAMTPQQLQVIRNSEVISREYFAAASGGTYDVRYGEIIDVPMPLNPDGTRRDDLVPGITGLDGVVAYAENYVSTNFGLNSEAFQTNVFDVSSTEPEPGQGWAGLAFGFNNFALQSDLDTSFGQIVVDHEHGHRIGAPHSSALRPVNDSAYTPYVYNHDAEAYEVYSPDVHGLTGNIYGIHRDEYGDPFSVMGNIGNGHFTVRDKSERLGWLSTDQVPSLFSLGEGVHRIYAHDELTPVYDETLDVYGVEEGYDEDAVYGIRYRRRSEEYQNDTGQFQFAGQDVFIEYRSGRDGLQFRVGNEIVDLDLEGGTDRGNLERELEVGRDIRGIDFAATQYQDGQGIDFLSLNPPAPSKPWEVIPNWWEFRVLEQGVDETGSYIEFLAGRENYVIEEGIEGDLNTDGSLDVLDWQVFVANFNADLSSQTYTSRYLAGDLDGNGFNDYNDFLAFKNLYNATHGAGAFAFARAQLSAIPEPSTGLLLIFAAAGLWTRRN